jgi:hypothetical protein
LEDLPPSEIEENVASSITAGDRWAWGHW